MYNKIPKISLRDFIISWRRPTLPPQRAILAVPSAKNKAHKKSLAKQGFSISWRRPTLPRPESNTSSTIEEVCTKKIPKISLRDFIISWRRPTLPPVRAVPSAQRGLTSLFGMGRGEHPCYNHH